MQIQVRKEDDVSIVDLKGKLVAGVGDAQLREVMDQLLAGDAKKILLNLSGVSSIDSSGIGELVSSLRVSERFGASIKLLRAGDHADHVLSMAQILPLFEVYDSEAAAIEHFEQPS